MRIIVIKTSISLLATSFLFILFNIQSGFAQGPNIPYPIIFIHGLNSSNATWSENSPLDVIDNLKAAGLQFGGNVNVTLNFNRSSSTLNTTLKESVHMYTKAIDSADFYTINFNLHSTGDVPDATNYNSIGTVYKDSQEIAVDDPAKFHLNDIIRIDDELMQVTDYDYTAFFGNYIKVNRPMFGSILNEHAAHSTIWDLSNESNQESITKQAYGLKKAIDLIKARTGAKKVILVGHSMGGLAAREYMRSYFNDDVAKVVTIGTPHLGSTAFDISNLVDSQVGIDPKSSAVRDLSYNYFGANGNPNPPYPSNVDNGIYLFGGDESTIGIKGDFYSEDVNGDGTINSVAGLNSNLQSAFPASVSYCWIVSQFPIPGVDGDGAVRLLRQFPWAEYGADGKPKIAIGDTIMTNRPHITLPKILGIPLNLAGINTFGETTDYYSIIRGLSVPDDPALAYEIMGNSTTRGFITVGRNQNTNDVDFYKITLKNNELLNFKVYSSFTGIHHFELLDDKQKPIVSYSDISQPIVYNGLSGKTYYIRIAGTAIVGQTPFYILSTKSTIIPTTTLSTLPNTTLSFYDVLLNQSLNKIIGITNNGPTPLLISNLTITGSNANQFSIVGATSYTIPAGQSQSVTVAFNPTAPGTKIAKLKIANNSTDNPVENILLQGNGVETPTKKMVLRPDTSYNFGNKSITVSNAEIFNISDTGSNKITISDITLIGADANQFSVSAQSVAPFDINSNGGTSDFILNFLPTSIGVKSAKIVINNNSDNKSMADTIAIFGNGTNSIYSGVAHSIIAYEYWFDDNYAGKASASLSGDQISVLNTAFPTVGLTTGTHKLNIRYQDSKGAWSGINSSIFYKSPLADGANRKMVAGEYWFDDNYAAKIPITAVGPGFTNVDSLIDASAVPVGLHKLNIRYRDDLGQWSTVVSSPFNKTSPKPYSVRNVTTCEYWFDDNYPAKTDIQINGVMTDTITRYLDASKLTNGLHNYHLRYRDDSGLWSTIMSGFFYKKTNGLPNSISTYRYWFDSDAQHLTVISLPTPVNPLNLQAALKIDKLTEGNHLLHLQFKDTRNAWSAATVDTFYYHKDVASIPTLQATNIKFSNISNTGLSLSWTNGNGTSRVVFIAPKTSIPPLPLDSTSYLPGATAAQGATIGSSGWFCVYNGSGSSASVTGLKAATAYRFMVLEYNGTTGTQRYLTSLSTGNPLKITTAYAKPTVQAINIIFTNTTSSGTTVNWTNGNGTSRVVFIAPKTSIPPLPLDSTTYTPGATAPQGSTIGSSGWFCVYNGPGSSAPVAGLKAGTAYRFMVLEYNGNTGTQRYLTSLSTNNPLKTTTLTVNPIGINNGVNNLALVAPSQATDVKVEAANILSPNGDGKNDTWIVKNIEQYPTNQVTITDQAGNTVFTQKGYANNWGGSYRGSIIPEGTYYYLIDLGNGSTLKGFITVVRD